MTNISTRIDVNAALNCRSARGTHHARVARARHLTSTGNTRPSTRPMWMYGLFPSGRPNLHGALLDVTATAGAHSHLAASTCTPVVAPACDSQWRLSASERRSGGTEERP